MRQPFSLRLNTLLRSLRWWLIAGALVFFIVAGGRRIRVDVVHAGETGVLGPGAEGRFIVTSPTTPAVSPLPLFAPPRPLRAGDLVRLSDGGIVEIVALPGARLESWRRPDGESELKRDQTLTGIILNPSDSGVLPPRLDEGAMLVRRSPGAEGLKVVAVADASARVLFVLGA